MKTRIKIFVLKKDNRYYQGESILNELKILSIQKETFQYYNFALGESWNSFRFSKISFIVEFLCSSAQESSLLFIEIVGNESRKSAQNIYQVSFETRFLISTPTRQINSITFAT